MLDAWILANESENKDLMKECVPLIIKQIDTLINNDDFCSKTRFEGMRVLLANWHNEDMVEEVKLKAITAWIDGGSTHDEQKRRTHHFIDFLPTLDLSKLSSTFVHNLTDGEIDFEMPDSCW